MMAIRRMRRCNARKKKMAMAIVDVMFAVQFSVAENEQTEIIRIIQN